MPMFVIHFAFMQFSVLVVLAIVVVGQVANGAGLHFGVFLMEATAHPLLLIRKSNTTKYENIGRRRKESQDLA